jgi:hypothetical protein
MKLETSTHIAMHLVLALKLGVTPGLAVLGGDEMNSILECILTGSRGLLLLCPFVPGA